MCRSSKTCQWQNFNFPQISSEQCCEKIQPYYLFLAIAKNEDHADLVKSIAEKFHVSHREISLQIPAITSKTVFEYFEKFLL